MSIPGDWKIRQGLLKDVVPVQFPAVLGSDVSGEVIAVGAKVSRFKPGDKVLAYVRKSHAELVAATPEQLALMPEGMGVRPSGHYSRSSRSPARSLWKVAFSQRQARW